MRSGFRGEAHKKLNRDGPRGVKSITRISVIAVDGPVAAGKTVVAGLLAHRLGYKYLDTGVMYRAITWLALL